jgi:hypothetical protein
VNSLYFSVFGVILSPNISSPFVATFPFFCRAFAHTTSDLYPVSSRLIRTGLIATKSKDFYYPSNFFPMYTAGPTCSSIGICVTITSMLCWAPKGVFSRFPQISSRGLSHLLHLIRLEGAVLHFQTSSPVRMCLCTAILNASRRFGGSPVLQSSWLVLRSSCSASGIQRIDGNALFNRLSGLCCFCNVCLRALFRCLVRLIFGILFRLEDLP